VGVAVGVGLLGAALGVFSYSAWRRRVMRRKIVPDSALLATTTTALRKDRHGLSPIASPVRPLELDPSSGASRNNKDLDDKAASLAAQRSEESVGEKSDPNNATQTTTSSQIADVANNAKTTAADSAIAEEEEEEGEEWKRNAALPAVGFEHEPPASPASPTLRNLDSLSELARNAAAGAARARSLAPGGGRLHSRGSEASYAGGTLISPPAVSRGFRLAKFAGLNLVSQHAHALTQRAAEKSPYYNKVTWERRKQQMLAPAAVALPAPFSPSPKHRGWGGKADTWTLEKREVVVSDDAVEEG